MFRKTVVAATLALGVLTSSCTDYLTILPADSVVEENFWQTKDQVYGMLATSYLKLLSDDAVVRAIIWGELRADNMTYNKDRGGSPKDLVECNITDEFEYSNWAVYYQAISNANLVLESAAKVLERDPDFSEGDLSVVLGEMYAMRALCHFYLVRTFRDIPLAMHSAKNDAEIPDYVQVHPLVALNTIMEDLDRAETLVRKSGKADAQNLGRISRNAVLAMKADVNLWRAAFATYYAGLGQNDYAQPGDAELYYNLCIENCSTVIDNMDKVLVEEDKKNNMQTKRLDWNLMPNKIDPKIDDNQDQPSIVYDQIFGEQKNSEESIFELQVQGSNTSNGEFDGTYKVYGTQNNANLVVVPNNFIEAAFSGETNRNYSTDDLRLYSYTNYRGGDVTGKKICVAKYAAKQSPATNWRDDENWDANWIVYRRSDVLLMWAEALVARQGASQEDFNKAYSIVRTINVRSKIDTTDIIDPVLPAQFLLADREAAWERVRKERLLELSFEGKRWYDLVRQALIAGKTEPILFVADKQDASKAGVAKIKMSSIDALFLPIYITELRYNKNLKQNPAYDKKDSSTQMN